MSGRQGFNPSRHSAGRQLQQMLVSRPDIRSLIGPAEEQVLVDVFAALERAVIWSTALSDIARDYMGAAAQSERAIQAFKDSGNVTPSVRGSHAQFSSPEPRP